MGKKQLNQSEIRRYAKHIMIPDIGIAGQIKLKGSRVLVIGAGGLGCPVLQYLCAAGIGNMGIVEFDVVNESNLQRQILYGSSDIGKLKSIITRDRLLQQNDKVNIEIFNIRFDEKNALELVKNYDIIVDATDNYETRYLINDACVINGKPMIHGAIYLFEGQVSVFNYHNGPTYRCYNPETVNSFKNPSPADTGLIGVLPGITGLYMANECIKIILELDDVLSGHALIFNIRDNSFYKTRVSRKEENTVIENLTINPE